MSRRGRSASGWATDGSAGPVLIRTVFERFPITIKGAFVLRGGDIDPHQVRFVRAVVARIPDGEQKVIPIDDVPLDVAPRRDLFLPFEATIADLEPSWYVVRSEVRIDGTVKQVQDSRPFAVSWPRGMMRTGSLAVAHDARVGARTLWIERLDLKADRTEILWRAEPEARFEPSFELRADDRSIESLPAAAGGGTDAPGGRRRAVTYPVPRDARALQLGVRDAAGGGSVALKIPLA